MSSVDDKDPISSLRERVGSDGNIDSGKSTAVERPRDPNTETFMGKSLTPSKNGVESDKAEEEDLSTRRRKIVGSRRRGKGNQAEITVPEGLSLSNLPKMVHEENRKSAEHTKALPPPPDEAAGGAEDSGNLISNKPVASPIRMAPPTQPVSAQAKMHASSAAKTTSPMHTPVVPSPLPGQSNSDRISQLERQLAQSKSDYTNAMNRLEMYDELCKQVMPNEESDAMVLCKYIDGNMAAAEERDVVVKQLEKAKHQLEESKLQSAKLEKALSQVTKAPTSAPTNTSDSELAAELETLKAELAKRGSELDSLRGSLSAKSEEIKLLHQQLEATRSVAAPLAELDTDDDDNSSIMALAEKELKTMEDLIARQEQYIAKLQTEVSPEKGHPTIA